MALTDTIAALIIHAAVEAARAAGPPIAITVVDSGGHVIAMQRMDGVAYIANDSSRRKAITANVFRMPTRGLATIAEMDPVVGGDLAKNADVCLVAGGVPIMRGAQCVGGLGVAGGRSEDDQRIAGVALAAASAALTAP